MDGPRFLYTDIHNNGVLTIYNECTEEDLAGFTEFDSVHQLSILVFSVQPTISIAQLIVRCINVRSLSIDGVKNLTLPPVIPTVTKLYIRNSDLDRLDIHMPNLVELSIIDVPITHIQSYPINQMYISRCRLLSHIHGFENLEELVIDGSSVYAVTHCPMLRDAAMTLCNNITIVERCIRLHMLNSHRQHNGVKHLVGNIWFINGSNATIYKKRHWLINKILAIVRPYDVVPMDDAKNAIDTIARCYKRYKFNKRHVIHTSLVHIPDDLIGLIAEY